MSTPFKRITAFVLCLIMMFSIVPTAFADGYYSISSCNAFNITDIYGNTVRFDPANGKAKIIIFGGIGSCGITDGYLHNLSKVIPYADTSQLEFFAIDVKNNSTASMLSYVNSAGLSSAIHFGNSSTYSSSSSSYYAVRAIYLRCYNSAVAQGTIESDGYIMPLVAYVDKSGTVATTTSSSVAPDKIASEISKTGCTVDYNPPLQTLNVTGLADYTAAYEILDIVNDARAENGLAALTMDKDLLEAAMLRAAECTVYYSHTRPDETLCYTASAKMDAENIALGYTSAEDVMEGWLNSSGHYANIMDPDMRSIGIGAFCTNGYYAWSQCFGMGRATQSSKPSNTNRTYSIKASTSTAEPDAGAASITTFVGKTYTPTFSLFVEYYWKTIVNNDSYTWSSSNSSVASVNSSGVITGKGTGTATITATNKGDPKSKFTFIVTVDTIPRLTLNTPINLSISSDRSVRYAFTAPADGTYAFASLSSGYDTIAYLYPDEESSTVLTYNDDNSTFGFYNLDFYLEYALKAGETVYLSPFYLSSTPAAVPVIVTNKITVTYNTNGGSGRIDPDTKLYDTDLPIPASIPYRNGYDFTGWNTKQDGSGTTYTYGGYYTDNKSITLYAQWEPTSGGDNSGSGGSNSIPALTLNTPQKLQLGYSEDAVFSFTAPSDGTYAFTAYGPVDSVGALYSDADCNNMLDYNDDKSINGAMRMNFYMEQSLNKGDTLYLNVHLYGVGTREFNVVVSKKLTVSYNMNGGSGSISSQTKVFGEVLTLSETTPTRSGYTFTGWNTKQDGKGTGYGSGDDYSANESITLYAQWRSNTTSSSTTTTKKTTTATTTTTKKPTTTTTTTTKKPTTTTTTTRKPTTTTTTKNPSTTTTTKKATTNTTKATTTGSAKIERIAGGSRTQTAVAISQKAFKTASTVILANGNDFADSLAGVPLAYAMNAPILLVRNSTLDADTKSEISRLGAKKVIILGGELAINNSVVSELNKIGCTVERVAGKSRFDTAVKIAEKLQTVTGKTPSEVFFAYSHGYADALSVSSVAAVKKAPILYISANGVLSDGTKAYLKSTGVKTATILGGKLAIADAAESNIKAAGVSSTPRVYGSSRYATCIEINKKYASVLSGSSVCIATGTNFPDALAGGVFAAKNKAPLVLVPPALTDTQTDYIDSRRPSNIYIFGGTGAVSTDIENNLK